MAKLEMVKTIFIKARPDQVWEFLTQAEKLGRWFHEADSDFKSGDDYFMKYENPERAEDKLLWGRVLEMDHPNKLVYTFTHSWLKEVETTVTWELSAINGGTHVVLTHSGFENCAEDDQYGMVSDHDKGWDQHFSRLRTVASYY